MKSSKAKFLECGYSANTRGDVFVEGVLEFKLHAEDYDLLKGVVLQAFNEASSEPGDIADVMQAFITWGIHQVTEEATGKKFTLRMDRPKKKA